MVLGECAFKVVITRPGVARSAPSGFRLFALLPHLRDAALLAESPAACLLSQSRDWSDRSRAQNPPNARPSIPGAARLGDPALRGGAAVSPGHTPPEGADGAPQLTPRSQGVYL